MTGEDQRDMIDECYEQATGLEAAEGVLSEIGKSAKEGKTTDEG